MTFYLKYRSKNFDEIDITSVRETLKTAFGSKKYPHALLFAGPKGTGKTSAARIVAKVINCEKPRKDGTPCDKCGQCIGIGKGTNIDVIELDAASHRGIEDIRTLREAVKLSSVLAKKKIYIIDEAHMLTAEASNAFLKTLEEPPEHVLFIFATTNPEKLIDTIRSRTTLVNFKKASSEEIIRSLVRISKLEKIKIDKESLDLIAAKSDGSFRDAIKTLEQLSTSNKKIVLKKTQELLESTDMFDSDKFFELLSKRDMRGCIELVQKASEDGINAKNLYTKIIDTLRSSFMAKNGLKGNNLDLFDLGETAALISLFNDAYAKMGISYLESIPLELAIVKWCQEGRDSRESKSIKKKLIDSAKPPVSNETKTEEGQNLDETLAHIDSQIWQQVTERVKSVNFALNALLRASKPLGMSANKIRLGVFYSFHKENLERERNRVTLEDIVSEIFGRRLSLDCVLCQPDQRELSPESNLEETNMSLTEGKSDDIIKVVKEIFG